MAYEFKLPDLGEGIASGEIKKWHVKKGEEVEEDQTIAEVETDKAVVEMPSPVTGVIEELNVPEGEKVNVGQVIATIREEGAPEEKKAPPVQSKAGEKAPGEKKAPPAPAKVEEKAPGAEKPAPPTPPEEKKGVPVLATPATRMLAKQMGIDIAAVKGSGPGGRITDEDVRKAAGKPPEKPAAPVAAGPVEHLPLRGIRRTIAENMMRSSSRTAQVTLVDDADMTRLVELRKGINEKLAGTAKVSFLAFMVKAVATALKDHAMLNASIDDEKGEIAIRKYYNIGIAVDTGRGLIVPVLKNADKKSIVEISRELVDLIGLTREGKIGVEQLKGGTFTIANIGSIGGLFSTPIVNYPESAILEMQQIRDMPRVVDGDVVVRKVMYLPLTIDHRLVDGAEGQRFLNDLKRYLEEPDLLLASMA